MCGIIHNYHLAGFVYRISQQVANPGLNKMKKWIQNSWLEPQHPSKDEQGIHCMYSFSFG